MLLKFQDWTRPGWRLLKQVESCWLDVVEGIMLSDEISKSGRILPRDNESPSGHKMTPSVDDETPSNEEGRQNNVTATVIEGYKVG